MLILYFSWTQLHSFFKVPVFLLDLVFCLFKCLLTVLTGERLNLDETGTCKLLIWRQSKLENLLAWKRERVCCAVISDVVQHRWLCWKQTRGHDVPNWRCKLHASEICSRPCLPGRSLSEESLAVFRSVPAAAVGCSTRALFCLLWLSRFVTRGGGRIVTR
jgi:hypothetical protein